MAVATKCILSFKKGESEHESIMLCIPAGEGKTYVYLFVCVWMLKHVYTNYKDKIMVITHNQPCAI